MEPSTPASVSKVPTPLTMERSWVTIQSICWYSSYWYRSFEVSYVYTCTKRRILLHRALWEIHRPVKNNFTAEVRTLRTRYHVLTEVIGATGWAIVPIVVNKPDKNGIRLYKDNSPLKTKLKRSEYPVPIAHHLFTEIGNVEVFT